MDVVANCPIIQIPGLPPWVGPALCVAYALLEAWLGKTEALKAGSVIELVTNALTAPFKKGDAPKP